MTGILSAALGRARAAGVADAHVVLDPGIGFFRDAGVSWHVWDATVLARLDRAARAWAAPSASACRASRSSARSRAAETPPQRLAGSLAATALAVQRGAAVVRTHDVAETVDAVRVAERLLARRRGEGTGP